VGEVARQARKDKESSASKPKNVITDDILPSHKLSSSAPAAIDTNSSSAPSSGGGDPLEEAIAKFNEADADFIKMDRLDRAALTKVALAEGCDVPFPNRGSWEDKLYAAKGQYVTHMGQRTETTAGHTRSRVGLLILRHRD
jgi:hypothetical protein